MEFDFGLWASGAVIAVGLIQWAKGAWPNCPGWVWSFMLPVTSFAASLSFSFSQSAYRDMFFNMLGIWVIAQISYELIIQTVKDLFTKKKEG